MKAPLLSRLGNSVDIATRLSDILHEHLGMGSFNKFDKMDEKLGHTHAAHYRVLQAHHNENCPLGYFISDLSEDISKTIYDKGKKLCEKRFNKFSQKKTKLTPEILEELWLDVSSLFTKRIYGAYDVISDFQNRGICSSDLLIPGLSFAITEGPIAFDKGTQSGDVELVRNVLKNDLDKTNDLIDFYMRVRNELFNDWHNNYGLFNGEIK